MEYGCIAKKLSHSFSKIIHERICDYDYELKELEPEDVGAFMSAREFKAINVTIPYKQTVIPYLDEISDIARDIGAVNTVVNRGGKLYGYNTDFSGMRALLLKSGIDPKGKKCAVLGTGGTSKTAQAVLLSLGASEILVVSRQGGNGVVTYGEFKACHRDTQIIINTTPCGMYPDIGVAAVDLDGFDALVGVADAVYNPLRPELVMMAKEKGIPATGGLYMLVAQAVYAAEKFTDTAIDESEIDRVYNEIYKQKQNTVLIGMPGCGKSTHGRLLANSLGLDFYDTDDEIVKKAGKSIPEIFASEGEKAFRDLETEVIRELSAKTGVVIATGGGAVLRTRNVRYLKQNGALIFIDRPIDEISHGEGRPLTPDRERLICLYNERLPIYTAECDVHFRTDGGVDKTFSQLLEIVNDSNG